MAKQLIHDLGGTKQVAEALGVSHGAVRNWLLDKRSIPWKHRPALARIAAERAVALPEDFWSPQAVAA